MSDFESRLTDALSSGAEAAPDASGLADGARRRRRQRRRTTIAAAAAAVIAVVAVPVGVIALNDGGGSDRGDVAEETPDTPNATRVETWHDLQVEVPASWGYGGRTAWCTGGQAETPVVERPGGVVAAIACDPTYSFGVSWGDGTTTISPVYPSGHVWQYEAGDIAEYVPGSWLGYWYEGDDLVQVNAADQETVQEIIDSVQRVESVDGNGCPVAREEGFTTDSEQMSVCRYDAEGQLEQSERLSADDTTAAIAALRAAPAGNAEIPASCAQDQQPRLVVQMITTDLNSEVILQAPCPYKPGITSGGESFQDLTADVLYWALSPGWTGALQDVPLPDQLRELPTPEPTEAPTAEGACPLQFAAEGSLTVDGAEGPPSLCHYGLDFGAESGGTWMLDDEQELSSDDEARLVAAVEAAPTSPGPSSGTCQGGAGGQGELFLLVRADATYWIYNTECHLSGVEVQRDEGLVEGHSLTQELLDEFGSAHGLLR